MRRESRETENVGEKVMERESTININNCGNGDRHQASKIKMRGGDEWTPATTTCSYYRPLSAKIPQARLGKALFTTTRHYTCFLRCLVNKHKPSVRQYPAHTWYQARFVMSYLHIFHIYTMVLKYYESTLFTYRYLVTIVNLVCVNCSLSRWCG